MEYRPEHLTWWNMNIVVAYKIKHKSPQTISWITLDHKVRRKGYPIKPWNQVMHSDSLTMIFTFSYRAGIRHISWAGI